MRKLSCISWRISISMFLWRIQRALLIFLSFNICVVRFNKHRFFILKPTTLICIVILVIKISSLFLLQD